MRNRWPAASRTGTDGEEEIEACELCGKQMQLKRGRFGPFYGCSGYPECRNIRKISKSGKSTRLPNLWTRNARSMTRNWSSARAALASSFRARIIRSASTSNAKPRAWPARARAAAERSCKRSKPRQGFLRLFRVSEVRRRLLGQAGDGKMPAMRRAFPAREDDQKGHHAGTAQMEECGYKSEVMPLSPREGPHQRSEREDQGTEPLSDSDAGLKNYISLTRVEPQLSRSPIS